MIRKLTIVTDAWKPQVNGVVKTISSIRKPLSQMGYDVKIVCPRMFATVPCPGYGEISLAVDGHKTGAIIDRQNPDFVHIATEGPLGLSAKLHCIANGIRHTSSFHTMYPEYLKEMMGMPTEVTYGYLQWFHSSSSKILVPTHSIKRILEGKGFSNMAIMPRGVDQHMFRPMARHAERTSPPTYVYVGRVSIEKNIGFFLGLDLPGKVVVIGDGPALNSLKSKHPKVTFTGFLHGKDLATRMASSDVFVFPSKSDTFGISIIEAMSCGLPVVAFDAPGPMDIIVPGTGLLSLTDEDFEKNCIDAISITWDRDMCVRHASTYTWDGVARTFSSNLVQTRDAREAAPASRMLEPARKFIRMMTDRISW